MWCVVFCLGLVLSVFFFFIIVLIFTYLLWPLECVYLSLHFYVFFLCIICRAGLVVLNSFSVFILGSFDFSFY